MLWANFYGCKWPNIENTIWSSGHTGDTGPILQNIYCCNCHKLQQNQTHFCVHIMNLQLQVLHLSVIAIFHA